MRSYGGEGRAASWPERGIPATAAAMPTRDARVDAYIAKAAPFARPILEHLRAVVHQAVADRPLLALHSPNRFFPAESG